jgi:hypothetical protein
VLGVDRIGTHGSFFALGGHLLLSRLRQASGVDIRPRDLFDAPTVEEFALPVIRAAGRKDQSEHAHARQRSDLEDVAFR